MKTEDKAIVVGAGVAGLSAASELAEQGIDVTLIESDRRCGGRLASWKDEEGDCVEHGIHGWWPSYINFFDLMARAGISKNVLRSADSNLVVLPDGDKILWKAPVRRLPSPVFVFPYICRNAGFVDLLALMRVGLAVLGFDPERDYETLDRVSFKSWLWSHGMTDWMYRLHFEPYVRAFAFTSPCEVSASAVISSLHFYFLRDQDSLVASWLDDDPQSLIVEPLVKHICSLGGTILLDTSLKEVVRGASGKVESLIVEHKRDVISKMETDFVVSALDLGSFRRIRGMSDIVDSRTTSISALDTTDVIVIRFWFEGNHLLDGVVSGVFTSGFFLDNFMVVSKMQQWARDSEETVVEVSACMVEDKRHLGEEELVGLARDDLYLAFPELSSAPRKYNVLVHRNMIPHFKVGSERGIPSVQTGVSNFFLAGDWVGRRPHSWHMERAVISGRLAASAILEALGKPGSKPLELAPPGSLLRLFSYTLRALKRVKGAFFDSSARRL